MKTLQSAYIRGWLQIGTMLAIPTGLALGPDKFVKAIGWGLAFLVVAVLLNLAWRKRKRRQPG